MLFLPLIFWDREVFCLKDEDATLGGTYMRISHSGLFVYLCTVCKGQTLYVHTAAGSFMV